MTDMKRIIFAVCVGLIAAGAYAQKDGDDKKADKKQEKIEQQQEERYTEQANQYVESFDLSNETGAQFINLYIEWQKARENIVDKYGYQQKAGADVNFKKLTEEEAEKMMEEEFDRQKKQAETDKEYYAKFLEILTPGHAAQVVLQTRNFAAGRMAQFRNMRRGGGMRGMRF